MAEDHAGGEQSQELAAAIAAVQQSPKERARWDRVEELLEVSQQPDVVSELFKGTLGELHAPELVAEVGQRGVRFYETWYGQDSAELIAWLERVRSADPRAQWAFERLTVALTAAERWGDLLDAYDRAIASADPAARRIRLLEEAAQIAKDFAADADRAIGYMLTLHGLDADNPALVALERLLERRERWDALTDLWLSRIGSQPAKQAREARIRLANCYLDKLGRPSDALEQVKHALADTPGYAPAFELMERVLVASSARVAERREALGLLKQHKLEARQPHEVVRVLELGLVQSTDAERKALLRELVDRLVDLGEDGPAMKHQAALLVLDPSARERDGLRALAQRTRDHGLHAKALIEGADHCAEREIAAELLLEAAAVVKDQLNDPERATALYQRVFAAGARVELTIEAGRQLVPLLDKVGREADTLEVLERMSELERDVRARRTLLGRMAKLAEGLGFKPRAEQAWQARLQDDAEDIEALEALINSAAEQQQWQRLAGLLEQRIRAQGASAQRRQDMVWLAGTYADRLGDSNAAIEVWRRIQANFGEDPQSITALTDLLGRAERWQELADVLSQAAAHQIGRFTELQTRLGDAYRERLDQPELAVHRYASALKVDPRLEAARKGQHALLHDPRCRASAIESLVDAYERSSEWEKTLGLLEDRLSIESSEVARAKLLLRAAELYEQHTGDPRAALACLRRAFTLTPDNRHAEREIRRLAERLDSWDAVISTYRETIASFPQPTPRMAELRHDEGRTLEERLRDPRGALAAYVQAAAIAPERVDLAGDALRVACDLGDWELAADQLVQCSKAVGQSVPELFAGLEAGAARMHAWDDLTAAMATAMRTREVGGKVARELHEKVAYWHLHKRMDERAAEVSLARAVEADASDLGSLRALAELQRRHPGEPLCATLLAIHELTHDDLDPLREAAEVAGNAVHEVEKRCAIWQRLYDRATELLRAGSQGSGNASAAECERWALDHLVQALSQTGAHERAYALLLGSAGLPLPADVRRHDLHRAAQIAARDLRDDARAVVLYRDLLKTEPSDRRVVKELAELYQRGDQLPELLTLKRHELTLEADLAAQLDLRLQIAGILGELEARGGRMQTLQENLRAKPGHAETIVAIRELLTGQGRLRELAELLRVQARELAKGEAERAGDLMRQAAQLFERDQQNSTAIETYRELYELAPEGDASASLARLHTAAGAHAQAAKWLELRLGHLPAASRAPTAIELAKALLQAGEPGRAQSFLEQALRDAPGRRDAREILAGMYRTQAAYEPLAGLLAAAAEHEADASERLSLLRESANIYCDVLHTPERALDALRRAATLAEGDREIAIKLGDALCTCGRFAEARLVFERLVEGFGRKRTPERAELHYRLAKVAKAAGDSTHAFEELENATKMDPGHVSALHMLAGLYQEQGDLERAERSYRSLLMLVRRQKPGEKQAVGQSEVFHALSTIADARGQKAQADEFLESAMEAAMQTDADASRFQALLKTQGRVELMMRLLQARLKLATDPAVLAEVHVAHAELLSGLGKRSEALEALSTALGLAPNEDGLHQRMRALAVDLNALDRYLKRLETLAEEAASRSDDESRRTAARLVLRQGETIEQELGDLERAAALYGRVEATGLHPLPTWTAIARLSKTRGDFGERRRALQRLVELPPELLNSEQRRAMLWSLVELELDVDAWREAGVRNLERALEDVVDYEHPKALLRAALGRTPEHARLNALFEQVARAARDAQMLLEHFERRSSAPDVSWRELREGSELAFRHQQEASAERLLQRASDLPEGALEPADRAWVLAKLSECARARGDVQSAIQRLRKALDFATDDGAEALCKELAQLAAGPNGDLEVAATAYARLLEAHPADPAYVQPLLDVYRRLGDRERFESFAQRCIGDMVSPDDRANVHFALGKFLAEVVGDEQAAAGPLKAALEDRPGHDEATGLLTRILERHGRDQELAELLQVSFDRARDEQNLAAIGSLALRMGSLYGDAQPQAAIDVYRSALEWLPAEQGLIEALLARLGPEGDLRERAELTHALLKLTRGPRAAELALGLAPMWEELYESEQVQQALELGYQAHPDHQVLRERLERFYMERQLWQPLSQLLEQEAERATNRTEALERLKRAAALYRSPIGDLDAASGALRKALALAPDDVALLGEMARTLAAGGQHETAIGDISRLLEAHPSQDPQRADLLRVRAELRLGTEDLRGAIADLEEAHAIAKEAITPALIDALERFKTAAFTSGDAAAERGAVMRLVELHEHGGDLLAAREALSGWVEQAPDDLEAVRALLRRDQAAGRWSEAAASCERLLEGEPPEARAATVLALADASARAGQPERARDWLERVQRESPDDAQVRTRLRQLYEETQAFGELAGLLLIEAKAIADTAERVALYQQAARLFLRVGDPSAALGPLGEASALQPDDMQTQLLMIDLSIQLGTLDDAERTLEAAIAAQRRGRSPELAALYQRKARLAAARQNSDEQLKWLNQASDIDRKSSEIASELTEAAIAAGNYDVAMKALRALTMMDDPKPITRAIAFLKQAEIANLRGDPRRAQHWARKAKSLDPNLREADTLLAALEGVVA